MKEKRKKKKGKKKKTEQVGRKLQRKGEVIDRNS